MKIDIALPLVVLSETKAAAGYNSNLLGEVSVRIQNNCSKVIIVKNYVYHLSNPLL